MPLDNSYNFKLLKIDELTINDHYWLDGSDICYYFTEYYSRKGYSYNKTNQLIYNFKAPKNKETRKCHKNQAIESIANLLQAYFVSLNQSNPSDKQLIFIAMPPSKALHDPLYDDRLIQVLNKILNSNIIKTDILFQRNSTPAAHESEKRPNPGDLKDLFEIRLTSLKGVVPKTIYIFDDILTTGCHFKAAKLKLQEVFPNSTIIGLFIARAVRLAEEIEPF